MDGVSLRWFGEHTLGCVASPRLYADAVKPSEGLSVCPCRCKPFQLCRGERYPQGRAHTRCGEAPSGEPLIGATPGHRRETGGPDFLFFL